MRLSLSSSANIPDSILFEEGGFAGRSLRMETLICDNPACRCEHATLHFLPETDEAPQPQPSTRIRIELDLARRAISDLETLKADPTALSLAKAIESEMSDTEWTQLRDLYFAVKADLSENPDPDKIDPCFPPEVLAGGSRMVGYYDILPYARPIDFPLGSDTWFVDDQYCVRSTCSCREAALSFFLRPLSPAPESGPIGSSLALRYGYDTGRIRPLSGTDAPGLSGQDLINALKSARPDLNSLLAQRHVLLRRLFRRAVRGKTVPLQTPNIVRPAAPKPRRNDPCPCGSGKKFKKCCGSSGSTLDG